MLDSDRNPRDSKVNARVDPKSSQLQAMTVVWALDPFTSDIELQKKVLKTITNIMPNGHIVPTYVLSRDNLNWSGSYSGAWTIEKRAEAKVAMRNLVTELTAVEGVSGDFSPTVLVQNQSSRVRAIEKICRFASKTHADLIVIGIRHTGALAHLLVADFPELLIKHSKVPVLLIHPTVAPSSCCETLVFATDFSSACANAFDTALNFALRLGAELHLFYKVANTIDPIVQSGVTMLGGGWVSVGSYVNAKKDNRAEEGLAWVEYAKAHGVKARWICDTDLGMVHEKTSQAIIDYANRCTNAMIVMISQSGPLASTLLGSITKEVVRATTCPVFVIP